MPKQKAFDETAIIDKAQVLFQKKGFEATSMQDLVDTLGISRSSIYDTFGDKENLYLTTLQHYCNANAFDLIEKAKTTTDPKGFIVALFNAIINDTKKDKDKKGCFVVNSMVEFGQSNKQVHHLINSNNKAFEQMLESLIFKAQALKQISLKHDAQHLSKFLFTNICGLRVLAKSNNTAEQLKQVAQIGLAVLD